MDKEQKYFNQREKVSEQQRQEKIIKLAELMHEKWRETRKKENGSYEARVKETNDTSWIEKHDGKNEVDIANTDFRELPMDWQEENLLSAKVAIEKIEEVLYIIHDKWLDRNDQHAENHQKVQYSSLSETEKSKDIAILEEAIEIMKGKL